MLRFVALASLPKENIDREFCQACLSCLFAISLGFYRQPKNKIEKAQKACLAKCFKSLVFFSMNPSMEWKSVFK
jgi:hypothetical protein